MKKLILLAIIVLSTNVNAQMKISELVPGTPAQNSDAFPIQRGNKNYKLTVLDIKNSVIPLILSDTTHIKKTDSIIYVSYCSGCLMESNWKYINDTIIIDTSFVNQTIVDSLNDHLAILKTWINDSSNRWKLTGNYGTNHDINFFGTIDNKNVVIKANNKLSGKIDIANNNSFWGYSAQSKSIRATQNVTAVGSYALENNGSLAGGQWYSGHWNTAIGSYAMNKNTYGSGNVAIGSDALRESTTARNNTAVGWDALHFFIGSSGGNTAVGNSSLIYLKNGSGNTVVGDVALYQDTLGSSNTVVGQWGLQNVRSGSNNAVVGANAGYTTNKCSATTLIGYASGYSLPKGDSCVMIGYAAGNYETSTNRFYIDNQARGNLANGRANAFMYGEFNAITSLQNLYLNSNVQIKENLMVLKKVAIGTSVPISLIDLKGNGTSNNLLKLDNNKLISNKDSGLIVTANGSMIMGDSSSMLYGTIFPIIKSRLTISDNYPLRLHTPNNVGGSSIRFSGKTDSDSIADYALIYGGIDQNTYGNNKGILSFVIPVTGYGVPTAKMTLNHQGRVFVGDTSSSLLTTIAQGAIGIRNNNINEDEVRLNIGVGGTEETGSEILHINSTNFARNSPQIKLSRGDTARAIIAVSGTSNDFILGSNDNDLTIKTGGGDILFSANSNDSLHLKIDNTGGVTVAKTLILQTTQESTSDSVLVISNDSVKYKILQPSPLPYKSWAAYVTFKGTSSPTVTEIYNDLGTVSVTRQTTGEYCFNSTSLFTANKTAMLSNVGGFKNPGEDGIYQVVLYNTTSRIKLATYKDVDKTNVDIGTSTQTPIFFEIRVYN